MGGERCAGGLYREDAERHHGRAHSSIETIEGIRKLSQNRPEGDRAGVLNGFSHSNDPAARQLAAEMTKKA